MLGGRIPMRNHVTESYVYRNLKHGRRARPLYSIMQGKRVVARRHRVLLSNCRFVVREASRQRALREERKNVHAFVVGRLTGSKGAFGIDCNGRDLPAKVTYNPFVAGYFMDEVGRPVKGARAVLLNERGMSACYLE